MEEKDSIAYIILQEQDLAQTIECLVKVFPGDNPLLKAVGMMNYEYYPIAKIICELAVSYGLSYIAKDQNNCQIIGFLLCQDFMTKDNEMKSLKKISEKVAPIRALIDRMDQQYRENHNFARGEIIYLLMLGVSQEYRRQGIAINLINKSINMAVSKGFKRAISQPVHTISQQIFLQLGFKEILSVNYKNYIFEGLKPFEKIEADQNLLVEKIL
jgi:ribosomal protein S18 acetylase RimI-like enzyme